MLPNQSRGCVKTPRRDWRVSAERESIFWSGCIWFSQRKKILLDEPHSVRQPPTTVYEAPNVSTHEPSVVYLIVSLHRAHHYFTA
jgi:hypothetical protein